MTSLELQQILLHEICEEYNHNVAQQLYISTHAWEQVTNAMNETVAVINQSAAEVSAEASRPILPKDLLTRDRKGSAAINTRIESAERGDSKCFLRKNEVGNTDKSDHIRPPLGQ